MMMLTLLVAAIQDFAESVSQKQKNDDEAYAADHRQC